MNLNFNNLPPAIKKRLIILLSIMVVLVLWDFYGLYTKVQRTYNYPSPIMALGLDVLTFLFLYLDIRQSKLYKTKYFYVLMFSAALFLLGLLIRLEHWPNGNLFLISACSLATVTYLLYFIKKPTKQKADWLKLIWVLSACVGGSLILMHKITPYYCMVTSLLFYAVFATQLKTIARSLFNRINSNPYDQFR